MIKKKNLKLKKKIVKKGEKSSWFKLPEEIKPWIRAILMFLISGIIILSFFDLAGIVGRTLMEVFTFLIGKVVFLLPLLFIFLGLTFLNPKYQKWPATILAFLILILGIAGSLHCLRVDTNLGGWIGLLVSWPVLKLFGVWSARVIFGTLIIISGVIFWYFLYLPKPKTKIKSEKPSLIKNIFTPKFKIKEVSSETPFSPPEEEGIGETPEQKSPSFPPLDLKPKPLPSFSKYRFPSPDLLERDREVPAAGDIKINSAIIKRTLQNFGIQVEMSEVNIGPTVTQYTLKPAEGIKLSRITSLASDLALALASHPIRIEAPIPGRPLVGIEIPNKVRAQVRLRNLIEHPSFQNSISNLTFCLGRDVSGNPIFADLSRMPHLLVAGATGTGKTIQLNTILMSLLYRNGPDLLRFILIDPKRVEFPVYNELPHLLCPVIFDAQKTVNVLKWLIGEMERRFELLSAEKARDLANYNEIMISRESPPLPYLILIIDELADLMAARGREMEGGIVRIAQMARAVGIHLIVATQRPSVEVITGLIKANITPRITFQVASQVDSRTVLDMAGAEKLLGKGDMLFISAEVVKPKRIQGAFISEKEIKKVINFIKKYQQQPSQAQALDLSESLEQTDRPGETYFLDEEDPLYEQAKKVVIEAKKASASLLQRKLKLGYARAARLIDMLEERRVVGPGEGAKPRKVLIGAEADEEDWKKV